MDSKIVCVPPEEVAKIWPAVRDMIDEAYEATDTPTPDVLSWLIDRKGLLWIAVEDEQVRGALTTSLVARRGGLALRIVACTATLELVRDHLGEIERYGHDEGCYKAILEGRQGWGRVLPGYTTKAVTLEKRI